jgi:glycoprotein endo-alpha-1,2-mannosidase
MNPNRLHRLATVVVLAVLAPLLVAGKQAALPTVDASHLRVVVETTSDWTRVQLTPGWFASRAPVNASAGIQATEMSDGWTLSGGDGSYQYMVADVVVGELGGAKDFTVRTTKGWHGATRVTIYDLDEGNVRRFYETNTVQSVTDPLNTRTWKLSRAAYLGTVPLALPKADTGRQVLAFYYPWFDTYDGSTLGDRPSDPRSTFKTRDVASMTAQAARNGVDGFVVSWRGETDARGLDLAVAAAESQGQVVSAYLETRNTGDEVTEDGVYDALVALGSRMRSPAWLRSDDGVAVVFAYEMGLLAPSKWRNVRAALEAEGMPLVIVGDADSHHFANVADGVHQYTAVGATVDRLAYGRRQAIEARAGVLTGVRDEPRVWAATVAPGYDDTLVRSPSTVVDREKGKRYEATWDAAVASDPDYVLVTSWNEWYETSSIEPSVRFGDKALRQTAQRAKAWNGR